MPALRATSRLIAAAALAATPATAQAARWEGPAPRATAAAARPDGLPRWAPALSARAVTADAATLSATVPRGSRGPVYFEWQALAARASGVWSASASRLVSPGRVATASIVLLRPATTYRFRLVAGGRRGRAATLRTRPAPAPPPDPRPDREPQPAPPPPAPDARAAPEPDPPSPPPRPTAPPGGYVNPLAERELPDPMVLRDGDTYWAYGTGDRFPILRSGDLVAWTGAGTALPARPAWAVDEPEWHPWAPSVARVGDGTYVLFFVALSDVLGVRTNCIGVATATSPAGPFADQGPLADETGAPIGCGDAAGHGNIDPAPFVDADGSAYLYVSTNWACEEQCTLKPELSVIPLADDLLSAKGPRQPLFRGLPDTWEQAPWAPVVENPWVVERDGRYHLLYSGGAWTGAYGMGHATSASPTGPFVRTRRFLTGTPEVDGPGGGMTVEGPKGGAWLVYHGRSRWPGAPRTLRIDRILWPAAGGAPKVAGPTAGVVAEGP